MYQDIGKMNTALRYLQEALKKNERLLGEEHIQTAVCYHALAIAFNCMGAFKLSHQVLYLRDICLAKSGKFCLYSLSFIEVHVSVLLELGITLP